MDKRKNAECRLKPIFMFFFFLLLIANVEIIELFFSRLFYSIFSSIFRQIISKEIRTNYEYHFIESIQEKQVKSNQRGNSIQIC